MEHWLHGFRLMGLIEPCKTGLRILREPTEADYALCRQAPDMPYANTRRVLDKLQNVAEDKRGAEREAEVARQQADLLGIAAE